jgi:hypothetical protein
MQESGMKNKIREQSPTKPNDKRVKDASIDVSTEIGDEELSQVSGGRLTCVKGEHIPKVKITV